MDKGSIELSSLGGVARAQKLTPKQRSEIARLGAMTRWAGVMVLEALPLTLLGREVPLLRLSNDLEALDASEVAELLQRPARHDARLPRGGKTAPTDTMRRLLPPSATKDPKTRDLKLSRVWWPDGRDGLALPVEDLHRVCGAWLRWNAPARITKRQQLSRDSSLQILQALKEQPIGARIAHAKERSSSRTTISSGSTLALHRLKEDKDLERDLLLAILHETHRLAARAAKSEEASADEDQLQQELQLLVESRIGTPKQSRSKEKRRSEIPEARRPLGSIIHRRVDRSFTRRERAIICLGILRSCTVPTELRESLERALPS